MPSHTLKNYPCVPRSKDDKKCLPSLATMRPKRINIPTVGGGGGGIERRGTIRQLDNGTRVHSDVSRNTVQPPPPSSGKTKEKPSDSTDPMIEGERSTGPSVEEVEDDPTSRPLIEEGEDSRLLIQDRSAPQLLDDDNSIAEVEDTRDDPMHALRRDEEDDLPEGVIAPSEETVHARETARDSHFGDDVETRPLQPTGDLVEESELADHVATIRSLTDQLKVATNKIDAGKDFLRNVTRLKNDKANPAGEGRWTVRHDPELNSLLATRTTDAERAKLVRDAKSERRPFGEGMEDLKGGKLNPFKEGDSLSSLKVPEMRVTPPHEVEQLGETEGPTESADFLSPEADQVVETNQQAEASGITDSAGAEGVAEADTIVESAVFGA